MESNLRWPVVWTSNAKAFLFIPIATAVDLQMHSPDNPPIVRRSVAILFLLSRWDDYYHFGFVPQEPEIQLYRGADAHEACYWVGLILSGQVDSCSSQVSSKAPVVAMAVVRTPIPRWIVDTGCGNDLVCRKDLRGHEHMFRHATHPQMLLTANGPTLADREIPLTIAKLANEEISPYILDQTPNVLSMGRRCVLDNYSFWWPGGSLSPAFTRPDGETCFCVVRGYIPYLEDDGSDTAPAMVATDIPLGQKITGIPKQVQRLLVTYLMSLAIPKSS